MEQISDTLLLATFCKARNVRTTIDLITDSFEVVGGKVFVLQDESDRYKKILTYNIVKDEIRKWRYLEEWNTLLDKEFYKKFKKTFDIFIYDVNEEMGFKILFNELMKINKNDLHSKISKFKFL